MRLNAVPKNLFGRIALRAGVVPTPLGDTIVAMTLARTIMVATKLGIFEALAKGACTTHEVAIRCGLDQYATEALLFVLDGAGYARASGQEMASHSSAISSTTSMRKRIAISSSTVRKPCALVATS